MQIHVYAVASNCLKALCAALILLCIAANASELTNAEKAVKLFTVLTGIRPMPGSELINQMTIKLDANDVMAAARLVTDASNGQREFYDSVLLSFASTFNRSESGLSSLNDLSALIIGATRDGLPMDAMITDDVYYYDTTITTGNNIWSETNNNHYQFIALNKSLRDSLKQVARSSLGTGQGKFPGVGIFTTRQWGQEFLQAGTNRRAWDFTVRLLYCSPLTGVKDLNVPDTYVARDVPRINGGDPSVFHKDCKGCHGMMDAFGRRAFLKNNFSGNRIVQLTTVNDKLNELNHPTEAVTNEDWFLYVTPTQNKVFGFSGPYQGMGLKTYAQTLASSAGWIDCMAKRVASQVYLKKPFSLSALTPDDFARLDQEAGAIQLLSERARSHRSLKILFEETAVEFLNSESRQ